MLFDLTEVLSSEGKVIQKQIPLTMTEFRYQRELYPIIRKSPVFLTVTHLNGTEVLLEAAAEVTAQIPCDRCLRDVERKFCLKVHREFDLKADRDSEEEALDGCSYLDGGLLDVEGMIFHELILNWPMKILCREDCKGICRKCGKDLNEGSCDCDTTELDPRMAKILDVFNNSR